MLLQLEHRPTSKMIEKASFSIVDYVLFVGSLIFSAGIGVYYAWRGGKSQTTKEVLFANKKLGTLPVAMSLVATFLSAISLLGYPAEIYQFGTMFYYYGLMYFVAFPLAAFVFLPTFYNLQLTSAYQYLELRFDRKVRLTASIIFCFQSIMYLSVVLYAPALALSSVTDISMPASVLTTGLVCAFYTSIGGAKAVVWTNVWQFLLIIAGLIAVVAGGMAQLGGFGHIWQIARDGGRINFVDFNPDPTVRHSFWSLMIGGTFTLLTLYSANQMTVQRYVSMKSLKSAQIAIVLNAPLNLFVITLYSLAGLIMYATYHDCDPRTSQAITKSDQILPYYVTNKLNHLTGLPGLFVSAIYGAGLSTLASGFNALSAVVLEDFVKPIYKWKTQKAFADHTAANITKVIALCFGLGTIGLAFVFSLIQSTVLQIALSIFGIGGGPILGVFCLGMFTPWPNAQGALAGLLTSVIFTSWVGFGPIFSGMKPTPLPVSIEGCWNGTNGSTFIQTSTIGANLINMSLYDNNYFYMELMTQSSSISPLTKFYSLSYQYYSLVGVIGVLLVGTIVSAITGFNDRNAVSPKLLIPLHDTFCCCLSERLKYKFHFGSDYVDVPPVDVSKHEESELKSSSEVGCDNKEPFLVKS